jgi:hypothetical protein
LEFQQRRAVLCLKKRPIKPIKPAGIDANLKRKIVGCLKTEHGIVQPSSKIALKNAGYDKYRNNKLDFISVRAGNYLSALGIK